MADENTILVSSLLAGIFITFVYDLLRIFRRVVPHRLIFLSLEDFAFWIYCGAEVFLLMYRESDGTLRWFAVAGALSGMFFYLKLVSPALVKYASLALTKLFGLAGRILKWFFRPFGIVFGNVRGKAGRTGRRAGRWMRRGKRAVKNRLTFFLKRLKMGFKFR